MLVISSEQNTSRIIYSLGQLLLVDMYSKFYAYTNNGEAKERLVRNVLK